MGEKTKEMEQWERKEVSNCVAHFANLERMEKTACVALINSREASSKSIATDKLVADIVSKTTQNRSAMEAFALVGEWQSKWLTLGSIIHMAVTHASANYDLILQVRAQKSVLASIILEIVISMLPELRILSVAFKAFTLDRGIIKVAGIGSAIQARASKPGAVPFDKVTELLDRRSKDITNAIRGGVSASKEIDAASRSLEASFQAKNQIFKTMLGNTAATLVEVSNRAALFNNYILRFSHIPNLKNEIAGYMKDVGLPYDQTPIPGNIWEQLSNQVLYDMLRAYCQAYVSRIKDAFDGLDSAQREMIYDRFANSYKNSFIHDAKHPYVNNDAELGDRWRIPSRTINIDYNVRPGQRR